MSAHDSWSLRGNPPPPHAERRVLPGEPETPEQAALHLLDSHAAAIFALTVRSRADFRLLPVLPSERRGELAAALLADGTVAPSLIESLAPILTHRLLRLRHRLRRRLGRLRVDVPLAAVREQDPVCLRHNARRPGRTLIEKAGAKQTLRAVIRVERFDTMENRVLVAACRAITRQATERLGTLSSDQQRAHPRARSLRRMADAAAVLLALPELAAVSLPSPGERPSFALLKDADYRAVYRALRLLRAEEERFVEEWNALPQVWTELLLLAVWAVMDASLPEAAVPAWSRPLHRRTSEGRLHGSAMRRWLRLEPDCIEEWQVEPTHAGVRVRYRLWSESDSVEESLDLDWPLGTLPADRRISQRIENRLAALGLPQRVRRASEQDENQAVAPDVALSALDAQLLLRSDERTAVVATSALAMLPTDPDERPIPVLGRSAAFLTAGVFGPHALHREQAEGLGRLIHPLLSRDQDPQRLALVIPDKMSEPAQRALRQTLGPCWGVWHTVAIALAFAKLHPAAACATGVDEERRLLVIGVSAATCDVSVIGLLGQDSDQRLLIRRPQLCMSLPGMESLLLDAVPSAEQEALRAAWLRTPDTMQPWVEQPGKSPAFRRQQQPDIHQALIQQIVAARDKLIRQVGSIDCTVLAGLPPLAATALGRGLARGPMFALTADAAVMGAQQFLLRYRAGLPTWEEELLPLSARVLDQEQRRHRRDVALIPPGQRIRPGTQLVYEAADTFTLPPDKHAIDIPMYQGHSGATAFHLHCHGRPLPLRRPVSVKIVLDYRYGFDGLRGELRAFDMAPFSRIPFYLRSPLDAESDSQPEVAQPQICIPRYVAPLPPTDRQIQDIRSSVAELRQFIKNLDPQKRRDAKKNASVLAVELRPRLRQIDEALKTLGGSGPDSMPSPLRSLLEETVGPFLEWLAGWSRSHEKDGEPPALAESEARRVLLSRARMRIRRTRNGDRFAEILFHQLRRDERIADVLRALGDVIDGVADTCWDSLVGFATGPQAELFRAKAWGVSRALSAHPDLAPSLSPEQAGQTLLALVDGVCSLQAGDPRMRSHFAIALQAIPHLCRVRQTGHLMPSHPAVLDAVVRLSVLRPQLAQETLSHAEGNRGPDEPLSQAIDALEGREVHLIFVKGDAA